MPATNKPDSTFKAYRAAPRTPFRGIKPIETVRLAFSALTANKLRTILTSLGVVIGVASVVALLSIGQGAQATIADSITANGANLLTVRSQGASAGEADQLTLADAEALADPINVPSAAQVSAEQQTIAGVVAGSESTMAQILGVQTNYLEIHNCSIQNGYFFDESNMTSASNVCVLGSGAAETLFPDGDPIGQTIRLRGISFKVVGVLAYKGTSGFSFDDSSIMVPLNTALKKLSRTNVTAASGEAAVQSIVVQAKDKDSIDATYNEVAAVLRQRHELPEDGSSDNFSITDQQDLISTLTETQQTMTMYLSSIAAISLIVGGIGIMNIMLVSVKERTHEIGLIKALGAREKDILTQFLLETVALSTMSGVVGVGLGAGAGITYGIVTTSQVTISPVSVILALGVSTAVGVFFGIDPARRAARLDPIVALRYE